MSKEVNFPNSQNDVLTTVTHTLLAFENMVREEMPNIPIIYSEELDFESSVKRILENSSYNNSGLTDIVPFFAYNRTIMRNVEDRHLGIRSKGKTGCTRVGDDVVQYAMAFGEFEIQFMYVSNSVELSEKFEVVYNSDEGISGSKEIVVDMDALGSFNYHMDYQELLEKSIVQEDNYYKMILGSIKVRGFYFTFRSQSGIIKEINQRILSSRNPKTEHEGEILGDIQIIPEE